MFVAIGLAAGFSSTTFGVGGGMVIVPLLVLLARFDGRPATATSLTAMIPVIVVGAWRQHRYGNVRWGPAVTIGLTSAAGVGGGAALADALAEHVLRTLFACLLLVVSAQLAWAVRRREGGH